MKKRKKQKKNKENVVYEKPHGLQIGSKLEEFLSLPSCSLESSKKNGDEPTCGSLLGRAFELGVALGVESSC